MLKRNGRLLNIADKELFYFDPHTSDYTGELDVLKGWCGGKHRVEKIINMDFIHDECGNPCFIQHADNYYEMRTRFFMCSKAFRRILPHSQRALTWVIDRGIYGIETLQKIRKELCDHIITWDKNYNKAKRQETSHILQQQIDQKNEKLEEIQHQVAAICCEESRLNVLIDEQYVRLDTRRKAFMDGIRISSRNIFYQLVREFRPLYNNYRDDHFVLRELTRSAGLIELRNGRIHVSLIPAMQYPPAVKEIVQQFLTNISEQINQHRGTGFVPLNIQLLCSESDTVQIDCVIQAE